MQIEEITDFETLKSYIKELEESLEGETALADRYQKKYKKAKKQLEIRDRFIVELVQTLQEWAKELNSLSGYDSANQSTCYSKKVQKIYCEMGRTIGLK